MIGKLVGGRYRLIAPLGEGGMATIWRAVDQQLDREVAVKILRPQFNADAGFAARFRQEARAAGSLSHTNIVNVFDYGTDEAEGQFIVMQLVEGRDLAAILRERGSLSVEDAVRVAISVASALEAAHRKGLVHRDVKPGNILIDDAGDVKVTDFGIARAVSEASMTVTGTTLGSVHYFSPEQARGDEVTGASDVYSLGIVLFEMLTGRRPFEGESAASVALKRLNEDAPRPSAFGRQLPAGLEAIVMRALRREPADRFPDAGAFAEALRVWRRNPDGVPAAAAGAAVAAATRPAATPPAGEPTVYVPPPVQRPSDRVPMAPAQRRARDYPPEPEREGQPWWIWLLAVLAVVLLGTVGFLGAQILGGLGPDETPEPTAELVEIPNWEGMTLTQVRSDANRLGLRIGDPVREPSDEFEEGRVISTDPPAGEEVERGSTVTVTVSTGRDEVQVPRLAGQTESQAQASLEAADLRLGSVERAFDPTVPEGAVIRSNPPGGTSVPRGEQIDLLISRGPEPTPTPTPTPEPTPPPTPTPEPTPPPTPTPEPTPQP